MITFVQNEYKMKQITLKIKDSYYAMFIQFLKTLAFVEIVEMEELCDTHFDSANSEINPITFFH